MLTLVPTPIGNLEDISYRCIRVLQEATTIYAEDTRVTKRLLTLLEERLSITFGSKQYYSLHSHNEAHRLMNMTETLRNEVCVYVSDAGMPGISDPGMMLIAHCQGEGIEYDVLPGANAALMARVMSGFSEGRFRFEGFFPHKGDARRSAMLNALYSGMPTVIYESPKRIEKCLKELSELAPEVPVFITKELTKHHQQWHKGTALELATKITTLNTKGEWVVVIDGLAAPKGDVEMIDAIKQLNLPKKESAKILARLTGETPKIWYQRLLEEG